MTIAYAAPLERAWARMVLLLFKPFRLAVWLVLGFAAFIGAAGSGGFRFSGGWRDRDLPAFQDRLEWLRNAFQDPLWVAVFVGLGVVGLAVGLLLAWVFARGAFVFLDDVLTARIAIVEPWNRFARQGNSLFLWRLGFGLVCLALASLLLLFWLPALREVFRGAEPSAVHLWPGMMAVLISVPVFLALAFVQVLLDHFVVPLMWAHGLRANEAWRRLLPILRAHPGPFVVYVLLLIGLAILIVGVTLAFGVFTCCCGLCILAIPYVGSVLTLPVTVPLRALGPEFLSQFPDALPPLPPPSPVRELPAPI